MKVLFLSDIHFGFSQKTILGVEKFLTLCKQHDFDRIIVTGDIITHKQKQFESFCKLFRRIFPDKPIAIVFGNHDYWDHDSFYKTKGYKRKFRTLKDIDDYHRDLMSKNNISWLQENSIITDTVEIHGMDGWYFHNEDEVAKLSNDYRYMPKRSGYNEKSAFDELRDRSDARLNEILYRDLSSDRVKVFATHFPFYLGNRKENLEMINNPKYLDIIADSFNFLLLGHSHEAKDFNHNGLRVLNVGSGYNDFKGLVIDFVNNTIVKVN